MINRAHFHARTPSSFEEVKAHVHTYARRHLRSYTRTKRIVLDILNGLIKNIVKIHIFSVPEQKLLSIFGTGFQKIANFGKTESLGNF